MTNSKTRGWSAGAIACGLYGALPICLSNSRPLWLDEVLQLTLTRDLGMRPLLAALRDVSGAVPLAYVLQSWAVAGLGFSAFSARIVSELASVAGCATMLVLCKELNVRKPLVVVGFWALIPLQLRYALEGRPYALALFFAALASLFFFRMLKRPSFLNAAGFAVGVVGGLYSQPYSALLQAGFLLGALMRPGARRWLPRYIIAAGFGALLFFPWLRYSAGTWRATAAAGFHPSAKLALLIFRELGGGGYICTAALLGFVVIGCLSPALERPLRRTLILGSVSAGVLAVAADAGFGYFFAIRQVVFVLVPLLPLATEGFSHVVERFGRPFQVVLSLVFVAASVTKSAGYLSDRSEDWSAAAARLEQGSRQGCLALIPTLSPELYFFFQPSLRSRVCPAPIQAPRVVVPTHRYSSTSERDALVEGLTKAGYGQERVERVGGSQIEIYARP